jgi:hypothetical protein
LSTSAAFRKKAFPSTPSLPVPSMHKPRTISKASVSESLRAARNPQSDWRTSKSLVLSVSETAVLFVGNGLSRAVALDSLLSVAFTAHPDP